MQIIQISKTTALISLSFVLAALAFWAPRNTTLQGQTTVNVTVNHQLDVGGTVTSSTGGINCGSDCSEDFANNATFTLTAAPSAGRAFHQWGTSGIAGCAGSTGSLHKGTTCTLTTSSTDATVTAYWTYAKYNVTVQKTGTGSGTVTSSPAGINCGKTCSAAYSYPTSFSLTATPSSDSTFAYWDTDGADVCKNSDKGSIGEKSTNPVCSDKTWNVYHQNYTAVAKFDKKPSSTSGSPSTSQPAPAADSPQTIAKPEAPKLETIKIDDQAVDTTKPISFAANKPLVLTGKTVANGVVTLFIFSEPKTATTTADNEGNWSYSVNDLPPGDHHVEVETKDPATGQTSERTKLLAFTITEAETPSIASNDQSPKQSSKRPLIALGIFILLAAGGAGWWFMRHRQATKPAEKVADSSETTPQ